jgi:hypothetical protein
MGSGRTLRSDVGHALFSIGALTSVGYGLTSTMARPTTVTERAIRQQRLLRDGFFAGIAVMAVGVLVPGLVGCPSSAAHRARSGAAHANSG